jgi:hypothetical protein
MPDSTRRTAPAAAVSTTAPAAPGESSDPAVHQLLAERQTAIANDDKDAIREMDRRLAELGY